MRLPRVLLTSFGDKKVGDSELASLLTVPCAGGQAGQGGRAFELVPIPGDDRRWAQGLARPQPDLVVCNVASSALASARQYFAEHRGQLKAPIIVVAESLNPREVVELLDSGASDYAVAPITASDILPRIWRLLRNGITDEQSVAEIREAATREAGTRAAAIREAEIREKVASRRIIGNSPALAAEIKKIPIIAGCDVGVLISGETGTGKELFARAIHYLSSRSHGPFTPVNCGAIPTDLVENELFGHERGAFTGASTPAAGLIAESDGGTMFLDEVDSLPPASQVKLLRFLQDKEYRPLGSTRTRSADVRIIAASNASLDQAVREGNLRQDLFYRLNIIPLHLPPLRERREDVALLAEHFRARFAIEFSKPTAGFTDAALQMLVLHDWPGNIRELEYVVERAVILTESAMIDKSGIILSCSAIHSPGIESFKTAKARTVERFERAYLEQLLAAFQGNISKAARAAKKNRRAFWELMRKHNLVRAPKGPPATTSI
jgi:DNA-binding NtrC family response regulator